MIFQYPNSLNDFSIYPDKVSVNEFIEKTKQNPMRYYNYCELVITPTGMIYEAIPSHQELMIHLYCKAYKCTRNEFNKEFLSSRLVYLNFMSYLMKKLNCVCVWYQQQDYYKKLNRYQRITLEKLSYNKLIIYNPQKVRL